LKLAPKPFTPIFAKMHKMKLNNRILVFTLILIATAVACKLLFGNNISMSGFSPIIAIAVFSGMMFKEKSMSFLLPLVAVFATDVVIEILHRINLFDYPGFYKNQWINYSLLLGCTLLGWAFKGKNYTSIAGAAIASPTLFFLLSNCSVWFFSKTLYAPNFQGLMDCYTAGLPFYKNALLATIVFLPSIVIAFNLIVKGNKSVTPVLA
jgi:hypothetical protein